MASKTTMNTQSAQGLLEALGNISLLDWVVRGFMIPIVLVTVGVLKHLIRYAKIQFYFANNLKRKVYFVTLTGKKNLQAEREHLRRMGIFNIDAEIKDLTGGDLRFLSLADRHSAFIIGYESSFPKFKELIDFTITNNIPTIIVAGHNELNEEDKNLVNKSLYCDVVNSLSRLAIVLMNIFMITLK